MFESASSWVDNSEASENVVASESVYVHDAETVQHKSRKKLPKTKIAYQTSTLNGKVFHVILIIFVMLVSLCLVAILDC